MSSIWTLRRSATDSKLAGLCAGVGRQWGVDPVLIRVGCVLLALSGGIGLVLYVAGWLLVPVDGKQEAPLHDLLGEPARSWSREVWVVITAACCVLAFAALSQLTPFGLGPAIVLALVWYFGHYRNRCQPFSSHPPEPGAAPYPSTSALPHAQVAPPQFYSYPGPPTPFTEAATAWRQRVEQAQVEGGQVEGARVNEVGPPAHYRGIYDPAPPAAGEDVSEPVGPASALPPAQPFGAPSGAEAHAYSSFLATPDPAGLYVDQRQAATAPPALLRRSASPAAKRLRLVALLAVGLTLAGLGTAEHLGVNIPLAVYWASALLVLGLTLVAATWWGRARGILPVALLVLLGTVGTTVSGPIAHHEGWDPVRKQYNTAAQLVPGDQLDLGRLEVDLTGLDMTANRSYTAHVDRGALQVSAPANANVVINWRFDTGALIVNDEDVRAGTGQSGRVDPPVRDPQEKTLTLNLSVDQGVVEVTR
ncbi:MAG TPA: PspC domain-containing protein [Propionibacteriaceae bacterium]